jgi:predicted site-specific integrase-resolvase
MRFCFELFKAICNFHEVEIIILKNEDITQPKTYEE